MEDRDTLDDTKIAELRARALKVIRDNLDGAPPRDISETDTFDDLNADSLDRMNILMAMEEEFQIEIDDGGFWSDLTGEMIEIGRVPLKNFIDEIMKLNAAARLAESHG